MNFLIFISYPNKIERKQETRTEQKSRKHKMRIKKQILLFFAAILVLFILFYFSQQKQQRNDNFFENARPSAVIVNGIDRNVTTTR